ncbi:MAG: radical SAM family heme chaperone HemW [Alphaproteobacteria bacterium]|nr:radical SAM family heme chaperone HemW [Alphaproteobacteria bacterium]
MAFGIYIHWPFCRSKCPYCDFYSKVSKNIPQEQIINEYIEDIKYYSQITSHQEVTSIFFGGGTPSLISAINIEKIINNISNHWKLANNIEISLEANPNTDNDSLFKDLRLAGINRLSLGIQSLNPTGLKFLGRTHSVAEALSSATKVLNIFDNHSADMIYALPHQSAHNWKEELTFLCEMGFKHLSLYQLTIEDGTVFAKKGILPANEKTSASMYKISNNILKQYGYQHYEVSNYAQIGYESSHNKLYWQGDDYIGIGPSAHGRIKFNNRIYATTHQRKLESLTAVERAEELILMGMRLTAGINKAHFKQICGIDFDNFISPQVISSLSQNNLIKNSSHHIKATSKGFLVLNKIIEELICNTLNINN